MSLLFADTHNVVAILEKSDAAEGFKQVIDFLSRSYIHYVLMVNPYIYISCIKQFWNTASVKRSGDVTRQPAEEGLVDEQVQVDDVVAAVVEENVAEDDAEFPTQLQQVLNLCSALSKCVENLENDNAAQKLEIVKLKARVKKLEKANQIKSSKLRCLRKVRTSRRVESSVDMEDVFNQGRMIDDMDMDEGIELVKIYNLDLDHSSKVLSMHEVSAASTTIPAASATIPAAKPSIPAAAPIVVAAYTRRRKGVIIRDPEEELPLKTPTETPKVKDKGKGILVETPNPMKKNDQIEMDTEYARKLQEEINRDHDGFNKDIDWAAAMDHVNQKSNNPQFDENMRFLFKSKEEMEEEDQEIIKSINETPVQKAAKRRKLIEEAQEAEDLRKRLEVVEDEDDDVPLAQKVPVVDYQIVLVDNKPRFKIIRADETHQFYISFTTLLKNFDREDLESLWRIVKDRFSTSKPTKFSDEYLLLTLKTMFTLEQLVNVTRLQVKEESEMSLEILRFTRQQLQEYQQG
nr:hypothetical protein [Tanacetum cinerariifolium]